jgi:predicted O-methyltransferase YrrM
VTHDRQYTFTQDWFSSTLPAWQSIQQQQGWDATTPITVVEVGSFEGRSSCWIADNLLLHPDAHLYCLDTFAGSMEHTAQEVEQLYDRFMHNIQATGKRDQITVLVGRSDDQLIELIRQQVQADLIYIDGSHMAQDVLVDAVLAWKMLKPGGVMIFDDYTWVIDAENMHKNPKIAIDSLVNVFFSSIEFIEVVAPIPNGQLYIRRRAGK